MQIPLGFINKTKDMRSKDALVVFTVPLVKTMMYVIKDKMVGTNLRQEMNKMRQEVAQEGGKNPSATTLKVGGRDAGAITWVQPIKGEEFRHTMYVVPAPQKQVFLVTTAIPLSKEKFWKEKCEIAAKTFRLN